MEIMKEEEEEEDEVSEGDTPKTESRHSNDEKVATGAPTMSAKSGTTSTTSEASIQDPVAETTEKLQSTKIDGLSETQTNHRSQTSTPRPGALPTRMMLTEKSDEETRTELDGMTAEERELRKKEKKKGGLSKEQREELAAYEAERRKIRQERVDTLSKKLIDRICVWTETDKGSETTFAFNEKTKYEVENLKMESFGIDILHGKLSEFFL